MKKFLTLFCLLVIAAFSANAQITVQGRPVNGDWTGKIKAAKANKTFPDAPNATTFSFNDIKLWTGDKDGDCQAALIVQWDVEGETNAYVWGFRWKSSEQMTGYDMILAVAKEDPRFYFMGTEDGPYGPQMNGMGYDVNGNNDLTVVYTNGKEQTAVDGFIASEQSNATPKDETDWWQSGFTGGSYWSYYLGENSSFTSLKYSDTGIGGRMLKNGSVDLWTWSSAESLKELAAAPTAAPAPTLPKEFTDGFFIQNEGSLGRNNESLTWVASDGTLYYTADWKANNSETKLFGTTSQYGTIYGDNYYVVSKQGPRFVVLDAKTLAKKNSLETIGDASNNDGRDLCAIDNSKVYVGGTDGIRVYDVASGKFTKDVTGSTGDYYATNSIVRIGKYVFAVQDRNGVLVIDPATDAVVNKLATDKDIVALVVSKDGNIWGDAGSELIRINPVSLETKAFTLSSNIISDNYHPAQICASLTENALFYNTGASSWTSDKLGKLLIDENGDITEDPNFTEFKLPEADDAAQTQVIYGAPGFDPISGNVIVTTTQSGFGQNYSHNWLHYVDPATGKILKTIKILSDSEEGALWFMSKPVFPDNAAPEIKLSSIELSGEAESFKVADFVSDTDNLPVLAVVEKAEIDNADVASVNYDGLNLIVTPASNGTASIELTVNSNGKTVSATVPVTVSGFSSVDNNLAEGISAFASNGKLYVNGAADGTATVYNMVGAVVASADLARTTAIDLGNAAKGTYVVKISTSKGSKSIKVML